MSNGSVSELILSTPNHTKDIGYAGIDKISNSPTVTWECHASLNLKTRSEWVGAST